MSNNYTPPNTLLYKYLSQTGVSEKDMIRVADDIAAYVQESLRGRKTPLSEFFKQAERDAFPKEAPEFYKTRADQKEKPPEFIKRVYGQWMTGEFNRTDIRNLDKSLYKALFNWEVKNKKIFEDLPNNFGIARSIIADENPKAKLSPEEKKLIAEERAQIRATFPTTAPELYCNRLRHEYPPAFIERVYGEWLKTGEFLRGDLRKLDSQAVVALNSWEHKHGRANINLPTGRNRRVTTKKDAMALASSEAHSLKAA